MTVDATDLFPMHLYIRHPIMARQEIRCLAGFEISDPTGLGVAVKTNVVVVGDHLIDVALQAACLEVGFCMTVQTHLPIWHAVWIRRLPAGLEEVRIMAREATEMLRHALEVNTLFELPFYFGKITGNHVRVVFVTIDTIERLLFGLGRVGVVLKSGLVAVFAAQGLVVRIFEALFWDVKIDQTAGDWIAVAECLHAVTSEAMFLLVCGGFCRWHLDGRQFECLDPTHTG